MLAACGGGGGRAQTTTTISPVQMQADAAVLSALIEDERTAIVGYSMIASQTAGSARSVATRFGAHEREHERALLRALAPLDAAPPRPRPDRDYAAGFPGLNGGDAALRFALDLENTQIAAYEDALGTVATPAVKTTITTILCVEAEHSSVVLGELHEPQAPAALVTGSKPT